RVGHSRGAAEEVRPDHGRYREGGPRTSREIERREPSALADGSRAAHCFLSTFSCRSFSILTTSLSSRRRPSISAFSASIFASGDFASPFFPAAGSTTNKVNGPLWSEQIMMRPLPVAATLLIWNSADVSSYLELPITLLSRLMSATYTLRL